MRPPTPSGRVLLLLPLPSWDTDCRRWGASEPPLPAVPLALARKAVCTLTDSACAAEALWTGATTVGSGTSSSDFRRVLSNRCLSSANSSSRARPGSLSKACPRVLGATDPRSGVCQRPESNRSDGCRWLCVSSKGPLLTLEEKEEVLSRLVVHTEVRRLEPLLL